MLYLPFGFVTSGPLWQWSGRSFQNKRKGKGKKSFYKAIVRGDETICVSYSDFSGLFLLSFSQLKSILDYCVCFGLAFYSARCPLAHNTPLVQRRPLANQDQGVVFQPIRIKRIVSILKLFYFFDRLVIARCLCPTQQRT